MKAVRCHRLDGPAGLIVEDVPPPELGPGDVRVRLAACGVNFPDLLMVENKYQHKPPLPFVPGMEGAGEVVEVGAGVTELGLGDQVITRQLTGAFAEECVVPEVRALRRPACFDAIQGAAFSVAYATAYHALVSRGGLRTGEWLLIHGASGGVGLAAVQLGSLFGARVIATGGDPAKLRIATEHGAEHAIDYGRGFREQVKEITAGAGADVIYDPVGGDVFEESLRCINWGGRLLVVGFAGGRIAGLKTNLPLLKGCAVVGVRGGEYARRDPVQGRADLEVLLAWAEEGKLTPHVSHILPLERAAEALHLMADRKVVGKAVLRIDGS
jgi:NADPH2:quinone reductase